MADIAELCRQVAEDSQHAYAELWQTIREELRGFVAGRISDEDTVSDIMQETLLGIWTSRRRMGGLLRPRAWIFRIARNKIVDFQRRGYRKRELPLPVEEFAALYAAAPDVSEVYDDYDLKTLAHILGSLSAPERTALFFRYVWHFDYGILGEIYHRSAETVKKVLSDMRLHIRRHYLIDTGVRPDIELPGGKRKRRLVVPEMGLRYHNVKMDDVETISVGYAKGKNIDLYYPSGRAPEVAAANCTSGTLHVTGEFGPAAAPSDGLPVNIITMGYPDEGTRRIAGVPLKDYEVYINWSQAMATVGFVAATYNTDRPEADLVDVARCLEENAQRLNIDMGRVGLWACSGCAETAMYLIRRYMTEAPGALRFVVFYYPCFSHQTVMPVLPEGYGEVPLLIVKAGLEMPELADEVDRFIGEYRSHNGTVTEMIHEEGNHAFDIFNDDRMTRVIIKDTLSFMKRWSAKPVYRAE